jgi:hypothetical protein
MCTKPLTLRVQVVKGIVSIMCTKPLVLRVQVVKGIVSVMCTKPLMLRVQVVKGIVEGCRQSGCPLLGGEVRPHAAYSPPPLPDLVSVARFIADCSDHFQSGDYPS